MKNAISSAIIAAALAMTVAGSAGAQGTQKATTTTTPPPPGPYAAGTVTATDTTTDTITIVDALGNSRTLDISANTFIHTEVKTTVSTLAIGNTVYVDGIPSGITANSLVSGDLNKVLPQPPPPPAPGATGSGTTATPTDAPPPPPPAAAYANGKIASLAPLTVSIGNDVSVVINLPASAKITRIDPEPLGSIKKGDKIVAGGTVNEDGSLEATLVAVNITPPAPAPPPAQ